MCDCVMLNGGASRISLHTREKRWPHCTGWNAAAVAAANVLGASESSVYLGSALLLGCLGLCVAGKQERVCLVERACTYHAGEQ